MILSVAEYCSAVWMRSAHVKLIDTQINVALRIISGTVHSTPIPWIHVLSNIPPASIAREQSAIRECVKFRNNPELPIYNDLISAPINQRLKSRKPFWIFYRNHTNIDDFKRRWKKWWNESSAPNTRSNSRSKRSQSTQENMASSQPHKNRSWLLRRLAK